MLITYLQGFGGSSTRMEIAAAIIALASRQPVHMGTDSKAFMDKALKLHHLIEQDKQPRRTWGTQHDGDLWKIYYEHAKHKGTNAIAITKMKGHATQKIEDNVVRECDKLGNDMADSAAEEGVKLLGNQR